MDTVVLPFPQPNDNDEVNRIDRLADYVSRNGLAFEDKVKADEINNINFNFLSDKSSNSYKYYKWKLFCFTYKLTNDKISNIIENYHNMLLSKSSGSIDLTNEDKEYLLVLLNDNNGSKDKIKSIRKWILDRPHSMIAIGLIFENFIESKRNSGSFNIILHSIYVINDVLYNSSNIKMKGIYTEIFKDDDIINNRSVEIIQCLFLRLVKILHFAYYSTKEETERLKINRIIELWLSKSFINENQSNLMTSCMKSGLFNDIPSCEPIVALCPPLAKSIVISHKLANQTQQTQQIAPSPQDIKIYQAPPPPPLPPQFQPAMNSINVPRLPPPNLPPNPPLVYPPFPPTNQSAYPPFMPTSGFPPFPLPPPPMPFIAQGIPNYLPVPPFPPQTIPLSNPAPQTNIDMSKLSVGYMANFAISAVKSGHPRYAPINPNTMILPPLKQIESGRLDARVNEFYSKIEHLSKQN